MTNIIRIPDSSGNVAFVASHTDAVKVRGKKSLTEELNIWNNVSLGTSIQAYIATTISNVNYPNGTWYTASGNYKSYIISVDDTKMYKVIPNANYASIIYFLADNSHVSLEEPSWVENYDRLSSSIRVTAGSDPFIFSLPSGTNYLSIVALSAGNNYTPSSLQVSVESIKERVSSLYTSVSSDAIRITTNENKIIDLKNSLELSGITDELINPEYADGSYANKYSATVPDSNHNAVCTYTALFVTKGDVVTILPNEELLDSSLGEYYAFGFCETNLTSALEKTKSLQPANKVGAELAYSKTQTQNTYTITKDACTMLCVNIVKYKTLDSEGNPLSTAAIVSLIPCSQYAKGELFKVLIQRTNSLIKRIESVEEVESDVNSNITSLTQKSSAICRSIVESFGQKCNLSNWSTNEESPYYYTFHSHSCEYDSSNKTLTIKAATSSTYQLFLCPVRRGDVFRLISESTVARRIYFAFSSNVSLIEQIISDVETQGSVTTEIESQLESIVFDNVYTSASMNNDICMVVPYDGYLLYYRYYQNFSSVRYYKVDRESLNLTSSETKKLIDSLEGMSLRSTITYNPTYCRGNIASKRLSSTSGNQKRMTTLSAIYAKKGDIVVATTHDASLIESGRINEGDRLSLGYYETNLTEPVASTTNVAAVNQLKVKDCSNTNNIRKWTVEKDACSMVYFTVARYSSTGAELTLQNGKNGNSEYEAYEPGELFTIDTIDPNSFEYRLDNIESGINSKNPADVVALHDRDETLFRLKNLKLVGCTSKYLTPGNLTFIHFSDIHQGEAQVSNLSRIMTFYNEYSSYIDFVLNTGDSVPDAMRDYKSSNGTSTPQSDAVSLAAAENYNMGKCLNVIGNHDTALKNDTSVSGSYNWVKYVGTGPAADEHGYDANDRCAYDRFIKPYVEDWESVAKPSTYNTSTLFQPENAEAEGKCYYYKDFYRGSYTNSGITTDYIIRLIVIDVMDFTKVGSNNVESCEQMAWLRNVLAASAGSEFIPANASEGTAAVNAKSYHIILASHYGIITERVSCPFSSFYSTGLQSADGAIIEPVLKAIGDFLNGEVGKAAINRSYFVCMLAGHNHSDVFGLYDCSIYQDSSVYEEVTQYVDSSENISITEDGQTRNVIITRSVPVVSVVETGEVQPECVRVFRIPVLRIDTACQTGQGGYKTMAHRTTDKSYDLFNIFNVNPYTKRWFVYRVGADFDTTLHHIGSMSYNYANLTNEDNILTMW